MGLVIFCVLIVLGMRFPKSQKVAIATAIFMIVLFGLNAQTPDYLNYKYTYRTLPLGITGAYEPLYEMLISLCRVLGVTYTGFRVLLGGICAGLIYLTGRKLTHNYAFAMVVFLAFPFVSFCSGIRNAVASAIVMYAVSCLVKSERRAIIKFALGVLIATGFHYSSIIYLLCLLIKVRLPKRMLFVGSVGLGIIAAFLVHKTTIIYELLKSITSSQKVLNWFSPDSGIESMGMGGVCFTAVYLGGMIVLSAIAKKMIHTQNQNAETELWENTAEDAMRIFVVMTLILALVLKNGTFLRLFHNVLFLAICACAEAAEIRIPMLKKGRSIKFPHAKVGITLFVVLLIFVENRSFMEHTPYHYFVALFENLLF